MLLFGIFLFLFQDSGVLPHVVIQDVSGLLVSEVHGSQFFCTLFLFPSIFSPCFHYEPHSGVSTLIAVLACLLHVVSLDSPRCFGLVMSLKGTRSCPGYLEGCVQVPYGLPDS